jgi:His/Glu/Gln/Arg/opine family amino acid ABC transporter permease subunit
MATLSDPRAAQPVVVYDEPPIKPPPVLAVGPLAWMRENLFRSTFDTILTIVAGALLIATTAGVIGWAIGAANWFVVTRNLRLFMIGTYPVEELWRVNVPALLCAFAVGFTIFAYLRVRFILVVVLIVIAALLLAVPPLVNTTAAPVSSFVVAGNVDVVSGTVTQTPQTDVAFIGRAGETVTIGFATAGENDERLAALAGFADRAASGLADAAINRAETEQMITTLQERLRSDLLTEGQRADATEDLDSLSVPPSVSETYALNTLPVEIQVLDGETLEVVADGLVEPGARPLVLQLPEDGWYVLRKTIAGEGEGAALLQATGIYPLIERNLTAGNEYARVTDDFTVTERRPRIDETNVPMLVLTDNQYQGERTVGDYLRLSLAPLFELMGRALVPMLAVGVVGYGAGWGLSRVAPLPRRTSDRRESVRAAATWLWIIVLIWTFVLIYGVQRFDAASLGNLLARFVWVGWMFFAGVNLQRAWGRPLIALVVVLGLAQAAIAEGLTPERLLGGFQAAFTWQPLPNSYFSDLMGVAIWLIVGFLAARQGATLRDKYSARNATLGAAISGLLWLITFIAPPLVISAAVSAGIMRETTAQNLIPLVDTRRWGGLLLTLVLTVVTILASFPIGVLLALGRRSSLPAVRWVCTAFIELVRGVPLITVLFLGMLLVPLINPALSNVDNAIRAMVGFTLFSAAYLAENVRGGLQSVPYGQEEAARALGLSNLQVTMLITLPQALRAVIPALVGQCIALFKDTSLVALVGLTDLTGISKGVVAQSEYVGLQTEVFVFISVIYFVFSYVMAYISRRIEASGSGAARRI